jgi:hypothetical protein
MTPTPAHDGNMAERLVAPMAWERMGLAAGSFESAGNVAHATPSPHDCCWCLLRARILLPNWPRFPGLRTNGKIRSGKAAAVRRRAKGGEGKKWKRVRGKQRATGKQQRAALIQALTTQSPLYGSRDSVDRGSEGVPSQRHSSEVIRRVQQRRPAPGVMGAGTFSAHLTGLSFEHPGAPLRACEHVDGIRPCVSCGRRATERGSAPVSACDAMPPATEGQRGGGGRQSEGVEAEEAAGRAGGGARLISNAGL